MLARSLCRLTSDRRRRPCCPDALAGIAVRPTSVPRLRPSGLAWRAWPPASWCDETTHASWRNCRGDRSDRNWRSRNSASCATIGRLPGTLAPCSWRRPEKRAGAGSLRDAPGRRSSEKDLREGNAPGMRRNLTIRGESFKGETLASFRVAHATRVLVVATRWNRLLQKRSSLRQSSRWRVAIASTRVTCAPQVLLSCLSNHDIFPTMADDRWRAARFARGKSEHQTAACRAECAGAVAEREPRRKVSQKTYGRRSTQVARQAKVKRRGKSSPLDAQAARQEKPHAVQDKTEEGQPVPPKKFAPRVSSHHVGL